MEEILASFTVATATFAGAKLLMLGELALYCYDYISDVLLTIKLDENCHTNYVKISIFFMIFSYLYSVAIGMY